MQVKHAALCVAFAAVMAVWCPAAAQIGASNDDGSGHRVLHVKKALDVDLEVLDWGGGGPPLLFLAGIQRVRGSQHLTCGRGRSLMPMADSVS